jgi:hypothetical protein
LTQLQKEIEEEKLKNKFKKLKETNDRLYEYHVFLEKKKKDEDEKHKMKEKEKALVSLNINNEENVKNFKEYMIKLNNSVDAKIEKHKNFMQIFDKKSKDNNYNVSQDSIAKDFSVTKVVETPMRSSFKQNENESHYNPNYVNSHWSDVTSPDYFSKKHNHKYYDYRNVQKGYLQYNREVIEEKEKRKIEEFDIKRKLREQDLKEVIIYK